MAQTMVLMTTHGSVVCGGPGGLYHIPVASLDGNDVPLEVDLHGVTRIGRHERMLTKTDTPLTLADLPGFPPGCEMLLGPGRRTAALRQDGRYFSAEPLRRSLARDRDAPGLWESFLFVTEDDFDAIRHLFRNSWIRSTTREVIRPADIVFREGFIVALGGLELDLRYNLPFMPHLQSYGTNGTEAFALNVLVDGWKIERLHLYRPFIYFTAFGSPYALDQAFTAIGSLFEFGGYDGHVHVITDQSAQTFLDAVPALDPQKFSIQNLASQDWVGYVAAKYAVLDHSPARDFQPLLFLDTDVVADAALEPLLATVVTLERMSAPLEEVSSLQTNPSVGASLIQRSGLNARFACGLNCGTVGIPNLQSCATLMDLARTIITNHSELFGRDYFRWVDQEVLNYVGFCVGQFDSAALLRFVRYGWKDTEFDATRRLGLIHFWPPVQDRPKLDRMRDYLGTLRSSGAPS